MVDFAERLLSDPVKVDAEPSRRERKKSTNGITTQTAMNTKSNCSHVLLKLEEVTRGIVFVRRREDARELSETLRKRGIRSMI